MFTWLCVHALYLTFHVCKYVCAFLFTRFACQHQESCVWHAAIFLRRTWWVTAPLQCWCVSFLEYDVRLCVCAVYVYSSCESPSGCLCSYTMSLHTQFWALNGGSWCLEYVSSMPLFKRERSLDPWDGTSRYVCTYACYCHSSTGKYPLNSQEIQFLVVIIIFAETKIHQM